MTGYPSVFIIMERPKEAIVLTQKKLEEWMQVALNEARLAAEAGEVPVGACVVVEDRIIATGRNMRQATGDPLAHAEVEALRAAARVLGSWNLEKATLVVTLEPCPMCTGAILQAHVGRLVFGAYDGRAGCCGTLYNLAADPRFASHVEVIGGVCREEAAARLRTFFLTRRQEDAKVY